ncbi:Very-long-chain (3R)-3-hydroxyacyl-[acyl-carrier protein] dehydratase [Bertholletia excelsa]
MSRLWSFYLFVYNSLQAVGWTISLIQLLAYFVSAKSFGSAYSSAGESVCFLQTIAFLEVIHGAIGIVPSGFLLPLMQWGGRVHFLLAIVRRIDEVQELPAVFLTFLSWGLIEVIRYPHYALNCIGSSPFLITYLRYTAFIILYPLGLAGEMWLMYQALPFIKAKNLHADAFTITPFAYYDFVRVLLLCYPFLWLKLYVHLIKQRNSKLGKQRKRKQN